MGDMSSMMGGMPPMRGMQMPQMGGFDMPGLSFREMPDMPLSSGGTNTQSQPEYTVALNMQQYSPEDITIKLNGQELTIEAASHGEQFKQKHIIPDNINLDEMSSSFSSDGVLVVKAPKK